MDIKLENLSASEIGQLVNQRKIKPSEVLKYFINQINDYNFLTNSFVQLHFDEALKEAEKEDKLLENGVNLGHFAGVPFGLKDFLPSKKGWFNTHGGVACLKKEDPESSVFCKAMEKAGGIAIGKTNAPSYGFRGTTDNKMYGPTLNPFNRKYNAGGSSGGSAAAIASGLVPISEGGDAGGSLRIPAAYCNLYGFKAGIGIIPSVNRPDAYSASHPFCTGGGLTKTVEDAAILLNYMKKYDEGDPCSKKTRINYLKAMNKDISNFRVGFTYDFDLFEVDEEVKNKFKETIEKFKKLGIKLHEIHFNWKHSRYEFEEAWCKGITIDPTIELEVAKEVGFDYLNTNKNDFPEEFIHYVNECKKMGIKDLYEYNLIRTEVLDQFNKAFKKCNFILSPVNCLPYIENSNDRNTKGNKKINDKEINQLIGFSEAYLVNFVGYPACSIPSGMLNNNVPFGAQLITKLNKEGDLLAISKAFEDKFPWRDNYKLIEKK